MQTIAIFQTRFDIGEVCFHHFETVSKKCGLTKDKRINLQQKVWRLIGRTPKHDAIKCIEMRQTLFDRRNAAIDRYRQMRKRHFQLMHKIIIKRRNVAVLFRREPLQPRLARMDNQRIDTGLRECFRHRPESFARLLIIHTDAAFDGDGNLHRCFHRRHAISHQLRFAHQTGPERTILHAV